MEYSWTDEEMARAQAYIDGNPLRAHTDLDVVRMLASTVPDEGSPDAAQAGKADA